MPSTRTVRFLAPSFLAPALAVVLLAAGTLSGCGGSSRSDSGNSAGSSNSTASSTPSPSASITPSPSPTPSAPASSTPPSATPSTPTVPRSPTAALLSATELPRLDPTAAWTQGGTGPAGPDAFGVCQKFDLLSIGAERAVQRTFTAGSETTAGEQVADFPDAQNAVRASTVLESWHRTCAGRVPGSEVQVGAITPVATSSGNGWWYVVRYRSGGTSHVHEFAMVLIGSRMALLKIDTTAPARSYPAGRDPMQLAVQAAAARLV